MKDNPIYTLLQNSILNKENLIAPYLQLPPIGTVAERIAIYRDGYYSRLEETLLGDYQTLSVVMGENAFSKMCHDYIALYPSSSYTLNYFGQHLNQFLAATPPYNKMPYLAEIACYEWAEAQAFTAADATLLTIDNLQSTPVSQWPDLQFYLHPSCVMLALHWNTFSVIKTLRENPKQRPKFKKLDHLQSIMVWRRHQQVRYYQLDQTEIILIRAIYNQATFMDICEQLNHLNDKEENIASFLVKKLHVWLQEQWLVHQSSDYPRKSS